MLANGRPTILILVAVAALVAPGVDALALAGGPGIAMPYSPPDVPTATSPVAVVTAFDAEVWTFTSQARTHVIAVPEGDWDRIILEFRETPLGAPAEADPWDRTFGVALGGVEVLRGTTPRTDFTLRKDVTGYASLLPPGGPATVSAQIDTWVGPGQAVTVKLEFYSDEPTADLVEAPYAAAVPVTAWAGMCAGSRLAVPVTFPDAAPTGAKVEFTLSGHGWEEAHFLNADGPRVFHVYVDGVEVAQATPMPYVYAILGIYGENERLHPVMWWTAQKAVDPLGVHMGPGEIPSDRAEIPTDLLPLLTGARTVEVALESPYGCTWITSVSFLLR